MCGFPVSKMCADRSQVVARLSQEHDRRVFNRDARQGSRSPRAGIDVDSVVPDIRMRHWRMTVHDESFVIPCGLEELVPNPDQIVHILLFDRDVWANAGVSEQKIAAAELIAQTLHEQFVGTRKRGEKAALQIEGSLGAVVRLDEVGCKRLHAAQWLPVLQDGR